MADKITSAEAFSFARDATMQDPALLQAILSGSMEGQRLREEMLRERLSKANDVIAAMAMAADARSTPGLKRHMELVAVRHLAPGVERDCAAVKDYVAARS